MHKGQDAVGAEGFSEQEADGRGYRGMGAKRRTRGQEKGPLQARPY